MKDPNSNKAYFEINQYFQPGPYNLTVGSKTQMIVIKDEVLSVKITLPTDNTNSTI